MTSSSRVGVPLVVLGVVVGVAASTLVAWAREPTPPDEASFQMYVFRYAPVEDQAGAGQTWISSHPDVVRAEGQRACDWLATYNREKRAGPPTVLVDALTETYLRETASQPIVDEPSVYRGAIAGQAWGNLCVDTYDRWLPAGHD